MGVIVVTVRAQAEDDSTRDYKLTLYRKDDNAALLSMQVAGLSAAGVPAAPVTVAPALHASVRNFSCVLGGTYPSLRIRLDLQSADSLYVRHDGDAFAARLAQDDESNTQHLSWPHTTLTVRMLPGYNRLKLNWEVLGAYHLNVWNGAEVAPPQVRLVLPDTRGALSVLRGSPLRLQAQIVSVDSRTALSDLTYEWYSPSHPGLQLVGRPLNSSSGSSDPTDEATVTGVDFSTHADSSGTDHVVTHRMVAVLNGGELWVNGSELAGLGRYTFAVRVIDSYPGHRTTDHQQPVMAEASITLDVLARRSLVSLGCEFIRDSSGQCAPCPEGAYCPGGGRMWPVPGYWSVDEWTVPTLCRVAEACPGVDLTTALQPGPNGTIIPTQANTGTALCATGYTGRSCVQCAAGWYQLDGGSCFPCGSHTDQTRDLAMAALVSVFVMLVLASAVTFLSAAHLAQWFQLFCVLQDLAVVGADGAKSSPMWRAQLVTAFRYISLINFDIEVLKPGCAGIPQLTFVHKFYFTLAAVLVTAALFALAALLRTGLFLRRQNKQLRQTQPAALQPIAGRSDDVSSNRNSAVPPWSGWLAWLCGGCCRRVASPFHTSAVQRESAWLAFRRRLQHALIILLCVFYLRLCVLQLKSFRCVRAPVPDPLSLSLEEGDHPQRLFLLEDLQTECYVGAHLQLIVVVVVLFALYTVALPLLCAVVLLREMGEPSTGGVSGWLWRHARWLRSARYKRLEASAAYSVASHAAASGPPARRAGGKAGKVAWVDAAAARESSRSRSDSESSSSRPRSRDARRSSLTKKPLARAEKRFSVTRVATGISTARSENLGFLFLAFRPSHFCAMSVILVMQVAFALVSVLVSDADLTRKLFLSGALMALQSMAIAVELPFRSWKDNFTRVLLGLASIIHTALLLLTHADSARNPYFIALVLLFVVATLLIVMRDYLPCRRPSFEDDSHEDEHELALLHALKPPSPPLLEAEQPLPPQLREESRSEGPVRLHPSPVQQPEPDEDSLPHPLLLPGFVIPEVPVEEAELEPEPECNAALQLPPPPALLDFLLQTCVAQPAALASEAACVATVYHAVQMQQRAAAAYFLQVAQTDQQRAAATAAANGSAQPPLVSVLPDVLPSFAVLELSVQHPSTRPEGGHVNTCPTGGELAHIGQSAPLPLLLSPLEAVQVALAHYRRVLRDVPFQPPPCTECCVEGCASAVSRRLLALRSAAMPTIVSSEDGRAPAIAAQPNEGGESNTDGERIRGIVASLSDHRALIPLLQAICVEETLRQVSEAQRNRLAEEKEQREARREQATAELSDSTPVPLPLSLDALELSLSALSTDALLKAAAAHAAAAAAASGEEAEPDSFASTAALQAVRASAAELVAARLERLRAEPSGGADGTEPSAATAAAISQLEALYRRLLDESLAVRDSAAWSSTQADDDMQRRLQRGKTTRAQRAIALALSNDELLQVFRMEEQDRQQQDMQRRIEAKRKQREQREAEELQRRKEAEWQSPPPPPVAPLVVKPVAAPAPAPVVKVPLLLSLDVVQQRLGSAPLALFAPVAPPPPLRSPVRSGIVSPALQPLSPSSRTSHSLLTVPPRVRRARHISLYLSADAVADVAAEPVAADNTIAASIADPEQAASAAFVASSPWRLQAIPVRPQSAAATNAVRGGHSRARSALVQGVRFQVGTAASSSGSKHAWDSHTDATVDALSSARTEDADVASATINAAPRSLLSCPTASASAVRLARPGTAAGRLQLPAPGIAAAALSVRGVHSLRASSVSPLPPLPAMIVAGSTDGDTDSESAPHDAAAAAPDSCSSPLNRMTPAQAHAVRRQSQSADKLAGAFFARQAAAAQIKLERLKQMRADTNLQQ